MQCDGWCVAMVFLFPELQSGARPGQKAKQVIASLIVTGFIRCGELEPSNRL